MIRKIALSAIPLLRTKRTAVPKRFYSNLNTLQSTHYFSSQKNDDTKNKSNQDSQKVKSEESQSAQKKLTDLTNQELLQMNTQQSIKIVRDNIKKMEQQRTKQNLQIKQLTDKMQSLDKHHNQAATKEQILLQNIKLQEQQLQRIKKRADKQIQDSKDYAITKLAKQLLEFSDSAKKCKLMAQQLLKAQTSDSQYLKKVSNLHKEFIQFLKLYEISQFDPINQPFDPNTSQALVSIPTPQGYTKNHVATTMMSGYKIKSRLLRSAKVGIFV